MNVDGLQSRIVGKHVVICNSDQRRNDGRQLFMSGIHDVMLCQRRKRTGCGATSVGLRHTSCLNEPRRLLRMPAFVASDTLALISGSAKAVFKAARCRA